MGEVRDSIALKPLGREAFFGGRPPPDWMGVGFGVEEGLGRGDLGLVSSGTPLRLSVRYIPRHLLPACRGTRGQPDICSLLHSTSPRETPMARGTGRCEARVLDPCKEDDLANGPA